MTEMPERESVVKATNTLPASITESFIETAIKNNLDVDKLEKLLALHERNQAAIAQREFEAHFAEMQKSYVPAFKTKSGAKDAYKYCPLPKILEVYAPILASHGFSYRWEETEGVNPKEKITTCFLSGYGFTRNASITLPFAPENAMINAIQARGATSEYGRRYTFMNVTGCIVADEMDTDGVMPKEKSETDLRAEILTETAYFPTKLKSFLRTQTQKITSFETLNSALTKIVEIKHRIKTGLMKLADANKKEALAALQHVDNSEDLKIWEENYLDNSQR